MNLKSIICSIVALCGPLTAFAAADLTDGAVYRFTNKHQNPHVITAPTLAGTITAGPLDESDNRQLWVAEQATGGTGFHLRSLSNGTYMTSPIKTSAAWTVTFTADPDDATMAFILTDDSLNDTAIQPVGYIPGTHYATAGFAHSNGGANATSAELVCWNSSDSPSRWAIELIDLPEEEINGYRANWSTPKGEITPNRVYHFVNKQYQTGIRVSGNQAARATANTADKGQLWIAEEAENGIIFRNYKSGGVLNSFRDYYDPWPISFTAEPDPATAIMHIEETPNGYIFEALEDFNLKQSYRDAHQSGGDEIVCWGTGAQATFWDINLMDHITEADIEAQRQRWNMDSDTSEIESLLAQIFSDSACTVLAPEFEAMTLDEIQASDAYSALPEVLRQMVRKVKTDDWSEEDWDSSHAKKFRVQLYEPYSDCDAARALTCIHPYTNLNNLTGIIANDGTTLYIMVDQDAADGAALYIAPRIYDESVEALNKLNGATPLHQGLNVINCLDDDALMAIYYVVTTNDGRQRLRPLTDFDDIKIHIEGGTLNGFFNSAGDALYSADTNEDWFYYRDRARFNRLPLISKHCILYFDFNDVTAGGETWPGLKNLLTPEQYEAGNFDLVATLKAWDDMFEAELLIMGLMSDDVIEAEKAAGRDWYDTNAGDDIAVNDYFKYFNNRLMGITQPEGYMSATWYRTNYHVNTMEKVVMNFPALGPDDLWGPAHEFGHMNQGPMNIVGCTEESNNVFSNVALFYRGSSTSRADYPSVQRENFNKGYNFHQQDTWGTTRMWFQLWLYYHAAGHNKRFYPRLYELLRQNPLVRGAANHVNAKDDLLHFAKMACIAAGEDLTDFFDSWGFLVPQDGFSISDYGQYYTYLSAEEIEQWREEIALLAEENGWKKNSAIIFIDDRVGSEKPSHPEFDKNKCGEMGGLNDFINGSDNIDGEYSFVINGSTVSVSGATGGVGFIIYDSDGRLLGFSNDHTFDVSAEAGQKLIAGEATLSVITSDNASVPVVDALKSSSFESKMESLTEAIGRAEAIDAKADYTETIVGRLKPSVVASLKARADITRKMLSDGEVTEENIDNLLAALNSELVKASNIALTEENTIQIMSGATYVFIDNKARSAGIYGIQASGDGQTIVPAVKSLINVDEPAQQWAFVPSDDNSGFYLRSISQNKYISIPATTETPLQLSETPMKFVAKVHEPGFISLTGEISGGVNCIHASGTYKIVRWEANDGSLWSIKRIDNPELETARQSLVEIIAQTRELANELAENVETIVPIELEESNYSSNAAPADNSWAVLFDNDPDTYFMSNADEDSTDGLDHHIRIQLPEPTADAEHLILKYRTRNDEAETFAPAEAVIEHSADGDDWTTARELNQSALPALHNLEFESETFEVPASTAFVRFSVSRSVQSAQELKARAVSAHAPFAISELTLASHRISCDPYVEVFPASNAEDVTAALRQCHNSEITLYNSAANTDDVKNAISAVTCHYETLLAIKDYDPIVGLDKINADENSAAIFDLQGRRISRITKSGIYIINGRKIAVKGSVD